MKHKWYDYAAAYVIMVVGLSVLGIVAACSFVFLLMGITA